MSTSKRTVTIAITNGAPEYTGDGSTGIMALRKGQRRWWVRQAGGQFTDTTPPNCAGDDTAQFTIEVAPGRYTIGTGVRTRIAITVTPDTAAITITPQRGDGRDALVDYRTARDARGMFDSWCTGEPTVATPIVPDPRPVTSALRSMAAELADEGPVVAPVHVLGCDALSGRTFPSSEIMTVIGNAVRDGLFTGADIGRTVRIVAGPSAVATAALRDPSDVTDPGDDGPEVTDPNLDPDWPGQSERDPTPLPAPVRTSTPPIRQPRGFTDRSWQSFDAGPAAASGDNTFTAEHGDGSDWTGKRDDGSAARIEEDYSFLSTCNGLKQAPPTVVLGGVVNATGRANLARSHAAWSSEPRTIDTLSDVSGAVLRERRCDVDVPAANGIRLSEAGGETLISWPGGPSLRAEGEGLRAMISDHSTAFERGGSLVRALSPRLRADVWNERIALSGNDQPRVLRTRTGGGLGERAVYATVSPGYTAMDADALCGLLSDAIGSMPGGSEARGAASYDPASTRLSVDAVWHADRVVNFAAGDVLKTGIRVTSHDGGGGSIRVSLLLLRNLCFNLYMLDSIDAAVARVVHRGDRDTMVRAVVAAIGKVQRYTDRFVQRWGHARATPIADIFEAPSSDTIANVRAVMREVCGVVDPTDDGPKLRPSGLPDIRLDTTGIERDVAVAALLASYREEPGDDVLSIANAINRVHARGVPEPVLLSAERVAPALIDHWGALA